MTKPIANTSRLTDLELAREIQAALLPSEPPRLPGLAVAAQTVQHFEVGGDFYDFIELPGGDLGLAIGDVSGKGVAAALIMSGLLSALRFVDHLAPRLKRLPAVPRERNLPRFVTLLNSFVYALAHSRKYATLFLARYAPPTGTLEYVNAGHSSPLLVADGSLTRLTSTGMPVGLFPDSPYTKDSVQLSAGATLFLYTDGVTEAVNAAGDEFGTERLEEAVADAATEDLDTLVLRVLETVSRFEDGAHAGDDKTVVALRRSGPHPARPPTRRRAPSRRTVGGARRPTERSLPQGT